MPRGAYAGLAVIGQCNLLYTTAITGMLSSQLPHKRCQEVLLLVGLVH